MWYDALIMTRLTAFLGVVLLLGVTGFPSALAAATFGSARTLVVSEPSDQNAYLFGTDVTVAVPLGADVLASGGTVRVAAPVTGDVMAVGGTIALEHEVAGDVRAFGGRVQVTGPVSGDVVVAGGTVSVAAQAADTRVAGGTVHVAGAAGPAVIYGADVRLSGTFTGDVRVIASDRITLDEGTVIEGSLRYDAPQEVALPPSATVGGELTYTGSSAFLPTTEQAQTFAIAGAGVFLLVRMVALLIMAALFAGLFPVFSQRVVDRTLAHTPGSFALLALLGFGIVVAAPVLIVLLLLSFVGAAVAAALLLGYLLLIFVAYVYAGIIAGAALGRGLLKRSEVSWRIALLGMLLLFLVGTVPVIGGAIAAVLFLVATGAIALITYRFAFTRTDTIELDEPEPLT